MRQRENSRRLLLDQSILSCHGQFAAKFAVASVSLQGLVKKECLAMRPSILRDKVNKEARSDFLLPFRVTLPLPSMFE